MELSQKIKSHLETITSLKQLEEDIHKPIYEGATIVHNRNFYPNIIKKLKARIFNKYLLSFVIETLKGLGLLPSEFKIKKINYKKIIQDNEKSRNVIILDMTIKEFLSMEPYYKNVIENIIEKEEYKKYEEYVKKMFNMTIRNYTKIFTFKNELDFPKTDFNKEIIEKIEKNLKRADTLLKEEQFNVKDKKKKA